MSGKPMRLANTIIAATFSLLPMLKIIDMMMSREPINWVSVTLNVVIWWLLLASIEFLLVNYRAASMNKYLQKLEEEKKLDEFFK